MRKTTWFVMLNGGRGYPLPLVDEDDNVMTFSSRTAAAVAAENNPLGAARGYQEYPWEMVDD